MNLLPKVVLVLLDATEDDDDQECTFLVCLKPPSMGLEMFLYLLMDKLEVPQQMLAITVIYLDRLSLLEDCECYLTDRNVHRVVTIGLLLACKFNSDKYFRNSEYGRLVGVNPRQVNEMEEAMVKAISYRLFVSPDEYENCVRGLQGI